jgi:hypothetical protein
MERDVREQLRAGADAVERAVELVGQYGDRHPVREQRSGEGAVQRLAGRGDLELGVALDRGEVVEVGEVVLADWLEHGEHQTGEPDRDADPGDGGPQVWHPRAVARQVATPPSPSPACTSRSARAVALRAVVVGLLPGRDVLGLAAPRLQRGRLERAAVRERELPRPPPSSFIFERWAVASSSLWPPDRNTTPGTAAGTTRGSSRRVASATCVTLCLRRALGAGEHHVRLEQDLLERHALVVQLAKTTCSVRVGRLVAALDRVRPVHQHLGLDDRNDSRFLHSAA